MRAFSSRDAFVYTSSFCEYTRFHINLSNKLEDGCPEHIAGSQLCIYLATILNPKYSTITLAVSSVHG